VLKVGIKFESVLHYLDFLMRDLYFINLILIKVKNEGIRSFFVLFFFLDFYLFSYITCYLCKADVTK